MGIAKAGKDEAKACAENPLPDLYVEATNKVVSVDGCKVSDVAVCKDMVSEGITCEGLSGFGNEEFWTGGSDSVAMSEEPKAIDIEHNKESFTSQHENNRSLSQGSSPLPSTDDGV